MAQKVMLAIKGLHMDGTPDGGTLEAFVAADYYEKNGNHYLFFTEKEESGEATKTRIKFCGSRLELVRSGAVSVRMVFEQKKKHMSDYKTPYGSFLMGIETKKLLLQEDSGNMKVVAEYALEMNEQHISDSTIVLHIRKAQD